MDYLNYRKNGAVINGEFYHVYGMFEFLKHFKYIVEIDDGYFMIDLTGLEKAQKLIKKGSEIFSPEGELLCNAWDLNDMISI